MTAAAELRLPFGDPCVKCGASSTAKDPRDRTCVCSPCVVCGKPTLGTCAVCGRSLGCHEHRVGIERHVETYCLATRERHIEMANLTPDELDKASKELRDRAPQPWPMPTGPWERG